MISMTYEQVDALRGMIREIDAERVAVSELPHNTIYVIAWRDDSDVPATVATISVAGTVRHEATVMA